MSSSAIRRKLALNIFYLGSSQGISWILTSIYLIIVPRHLGPSGMGTIGLATSISAIIGSFAGLGIGTYLLREVARNPEKSKTMVGGYIALRLLVCLVGWSGVITVFFFLPEGDTLRPILLIFAAADLVNMFVFPMQMTLQALDKMQYALINTLLTKVLATIAAFLFVMLNYGVVMFAWIELGCVLLAAWVMLLGFKKYTSTSFITDPAIYKVLLKGGAAFLVYEVSLYIYLNLDQLLLASLVNTEVLGYYAVAFRLVGTLTSVPLVLGQAILPTLSRMAVNNSDGEMEDTSRRMLTFMLCASLPVGVGATLVAGQFIVLVYGPTFTPTVPIMIILSWTLVPIYLGMGLYQILVAKDRQVIWTKVMVMGVLVNLGLNLVLINVFQANTGNGGIGAAISLLVTELFIAVVGLILVGREVINRELGRDVLKSLGAAGLMALVVWPLRDMMLLIPIAAGALTYGIGILAFGLVKIEHLGLVFGKIFGGARRRLRQRFTGVK